MISELEQQIAVPFPVRETPTGVRVIAPTGRIGYIPEEHLEAALAAGAKVLSTDEMKRLRQEVFMQHGIFKEAHEFVKPRKRRSIIRSSRTRSGSHS